MRAAALTDGHVTSDLSSGVPGAARGPARGRRPLDGAVQAARERLTAQPGCAETLAAVDAALALAPPPRRRTPPSARSARPIRGRRGARQGLVAEEALGIALFCALRYRAAYAAAVQAAATITGDSDSTASVAGAIIGAAFGLDVVPGPWAALVEQRELLLGLADELAGA